MSPCATVVPARPRTELHTGRLVAALDQSASQPLPDAIGFLRKDTGIQDRDQLAQHVLSVQEEAYRSRPYYGTRQFFLIKWRRARRASTKALCIRVYSPPSEGWENQDRTKVRSKHTKAATLDSGREIPRGLAELLRAHDRARPVCRHAGAQVAMPQVPSSGADEWTARRPASTWKPAAPV